jgi:hypothetical protein
MANKRYVVIIRVEKEFKRAVRAKSEREAVSKVKTAISSKPIKITKRDFEKFPSVWE